VKNILDLVILKTVQEAARCGYDIIGHIHNTFHVLLSPGTVYYLLNAMEQQGILVTELRGKKKYYTLTREGNDVLEAVASEYMKVHHRLNRNTGEV